MDERTGCASRVLAASGRCRVTACDHGVLHLSLDRVTVRLTPDELRAVAAAAVAAAKAIDGKRAVATGRRLLC